MKSASKIRFGLRQADCDRENLQMSEWGCSNCLFHQEERGATSVLFPLHYLTSRGWKEKRWSCSHARYHLTSWTRREMSTFPTDLSQQWGKCRVVMNQRAMRCSSSRFSCRASPRALNRQFSITSGGLKMARHSETGERDREGERAWAKVIIWITAGNWITLRRGRLIGQQWVELSLDR